MADTLKEMEAFVFSGKFETMVQHYPEEWGEAVQLCKECLDSELGWKSHAIRTGYRSALITALGCVAASIMLKASSIKFLISLVLSVSVVMIICTIILPWNINKRIRRWANILVELENIKTRQERRCYGHQKNAG